MHMRISLQRFLMPETWAFVNQHNKLFLQRPDWMLAATCISTYVLLCGYFLILVATVLNAWKPLAVPVLLFLGAKIYAILFYHYMEFTHPSLAPTADSLVPYFGAEGPYLISMVLVLLKVMRALRNSGISEGKKTA